MALESIAALLWKKRMVQVTVIAAAWAALLLVGAAWWAGDSILQAISGIGWQLWIATFALFAGNHLLRFVRWHWMLAAEGYAIPAHRSLVIFLAGLALLPTPGKAGVAVRSLLLVDEGVPVNVSLAAYFSERLFDLLGLIALAALVLGSGSDNRWIVALCGGLAAVAAVRMGPRCCRWLEARWTGSERVRHALSWMTLLLDHGAKLVVGRLFLPFWLLGILANVLTGALLWLALSRFGVPIPLADALGILGISHLSGSLSLLPGGLGGFELAMLGQLSALSIPAASAIVALALVRLATIWGSVAVGLPLLVYCLRTAGSPQHTTVDRTIPHP